MSYLVGMLFFDEEGRIAWGNTVITYSEDDGEIFTLSCIRDLEEFLAKEYNGSKVHIMGITPIVDDSKEEE
jgi:hypothetical protein